MRFQCPSCQTWQAADGDPGTQTERSCGQCGVLLTLTRVTDDDGPRWEASVQPARAVRVEGEDPLRQLVENAEKAPDEARLEQLTGVRAQLVALTACLSPRLVLPAALLVALGLALAVGVVVVGQRIEKSLALLLAPAALGVVAWTLVVAAAAVAHLVHVRLGGTLVGMGRSLRMMLEHGNGAAGSALRFVVLGTLGATVCALVALLGAVPGLAGNQGLAITGGLFFLQLLAVMAALAGLTLMAMALVLHPGLATAGPVPAPRMFRFVWSLVRRDPGELVRRATLPLLASGGLAMVGLVVVQVALRVVVALNARVLGDGYADLLSASPLRVLFGVPELLDPGTALTLGGFLMAASLTLCAAVVLGGVACFLGLSSYLLAKGLDLQGKL